MDLLNPHLLSTEQILKILKERQLEIPNINNLEREKILQYYFDFALPLHQRNSEASNEAVFENSTTHTINHRLKLSCNGNRSENGKRHIRIQPPIENGNDNIVAKKIKLVSTQSTVNKSNGLIIKRTHDPEENVEPPRKHKKITWP